MIWKTKKYCSFFPPIWNALDRLTTSNDQRDASRPKDDARQSYQRNWN